MKDFFSSKSFKSLIITVVILVAVCILSNVDNTILSSFFNTLTVSMQGVSASAADSVTKKSYEELEKENQLLAEEVAQLRAQVVDYYDVKQENARLWKYYDLKRDNPTYDLLPASVIRRDPNDEFYSFTMDKGLSSGVSVNDVVVTENGVVGWVYQVDATTSKVKTILSNETKIGALDKITRDSGVVTGSVNYADNNQTAFTKISASNTIKPGDIIVTTGISGIYPANLVVGQVKELKYDEFDTSLYAVVEPYENIKSVTDVVIITGFTGQGEVLTKEQTSTTEPATQPKTTENTGTEDTSGEDTTEESSEE